jgi:type I restriction enzyme, S subunit
MIAATSLAWRRVSLGTIAEFRNGINYNKSNFGKGIRVIGVKDFHDRSSPNYGELEEINPEDVVRAAHLLCEGDLLFVRSNGNRELIGRSMFIRNLPGQAMTHSAFTIRVRLTAQEAMPRFFAYVFRSKLIRDILSAQGNGANISNLNQDILARLQVPLPNLEIQRRIASILSAYDDLIENNTRRIAILDEMAQRIYEEWFVRFRFPGHENARMVDSVLGPIPKGWKVCLLGDEIELAYGKALKASERAAGKIPVYGSSGVVGYNNVGLAAGPGIIVGRKGNVGSVHWSESPFYPIDTVFFVRTELPLHFVFFNLQRQNFLNNDAAVPGLNRNQAYALPLLLPVGELLARFEEFCQSTFSLARTLARKNVKLRFTRDLLLPKLISGELDASSLPAPEIAIA